MRKIKVVFSLFLLLCLLCACGLFLSYEDTNGDDNYELQTITEEMIIDGSKYSSVNSFETTVNNKTKVTIKKFNGVKTLKTFNKGSYTINLNFEVTKGNAKLVLCDNDKIIYEFIINADNQTYIIDAESRVYLKIAGESCAFELTYSYS